MKHVFRLEIRPRIVPFTCVATLLLLAPGAAHADVSDAVYEDVKAIISDLMTAEIAESIVPEAVCRAGREEVGEAESKTDPAVITLRRDDPGAGALDDGVTIEKLFAQDKRKVVFYRLLALQHFPRTVQRAYARQISALRSSVVEESADLAGYVLWRGLGDKTFAAGKLSGRKSKTETKALMDQIQNATSDREEDKKRLTFGPLSDFNHANCIEQVGKKLKADLFSGPVSPLDEACDNPTDEGKRLQCELALALRSTLDRKREMAEEHLIRAASSAIMETVMALAPIADQKKEGELRERVILALRDMVTTASGSPDGFQAALTKVLKDLGIGDDTMKPLWAKLRPAIARVSSQWRLASVADDKIDLATFIDLLSGKDGALALVCSDQTLPACKMITSMSDLLARGKDLWPIIRSASRQDVREVAHRTVVWLFRDRNGDGSSCDEGTTNARCSVDIYRQFADTLVVYVIDSAENGSPSDATRAAFREAAIDAIREAGMGGGIDSPRWRNLFSPGLALRASWNGGYVNRGGGSLRYIASVTWPTARLPLVYREHYYLALHGSFVDLLAPLSELAVRDNTGATFSKSGRLAWNTITPRGELLFGLPSFSRHLLVGAGMSLRLVAPIFTGTQHLEGTTIVKDYEYRFVNQDQFSRYLEFGFVAKYVM